MSDEPVKHACRTCLAPLPSADAECRCGGRPWEQPRDARRYTLDEVRAAFWATFHESGEREFVRRSRRGGPGGSIVESDHAAAEAARAAVWDEFVEALGREEMGR
jgi:hypothetical protein